MVWQSRYGADSGGGYTESLAVSPFVTGHYALGGDTWGLRFTQDGGNRWMGSQQGVNGSQHARACAYSKRAATPGMRFYGLGTNQTYGGGFYFAVPDDGQIRPIDTAASFGLNGPNANNTARRPCGQHIDTWVSGNTASDIERIFTVTRQDGLLMYSNDSTASGIVAKGNAIGGPVTLCGPAEIGDVCRLFVEVLDDRHLVVINWDHTNAGGAIPTDVFIVTTTATDWSGATGANTSAGNPIGNVPAAGRVYEIHRGKNGTLYAACGYDGVYSVAFSGTAFTWTNLDPGGFFNVSNANALVSTVDATSTGIVYAGQGGTNGSWGNSSTGLPLGHAVARRSAAGTWTWSTLAPAVHLNEFQEGDGTTGTGPLWWLRSKNKWLGGAAFDSSVLRVDRFNDNQVMLVGRAGAWSTRDGGSTWWPAQRGVNGGSQTGTIRTSGGQQAAISNQDDVACVSTDSMHSGNVQGTLPAGTAGVGLGGATTNYTGLDGAHYVFTRGNGASPATLTKGGVQISDDEFGWAITDPSQLLVLPNGTVLIAQGDGGCFTLADVTTSGPKSVTLTQATEFDTATDLTFTSSAKTATLTQATEVDTALPLAVAASGGGTGVMVVGTPMGRVTHTAILEQATETDSAHTIIAGNPSDVANLAAWYDFADTATLFTDTGRTTPVSADGQIIKGVTDKSGSAVHLSEATNGPTYKEDIYNGLSIARFDGVNDKLTGTATRSQPYTVIVAIKRSSDGAFLGLRTSAGAYEKFETGAGWSAFAGASIAFGSADTTNVTIGAVVFNGTSSHTWFGGGVAVSGDLGTAAINTIVFPQDATTAFDLCEAAAYSRALTTNEIDIIGQSLASKWGASWTTSTLPSQSVSLEQASEDESAFDLSEVKQGKNMQLVQSGASTGTTQVTSWTATLASPTTAGNLILLVHGPLENADDRVYDTPTGYSVVRQVQRGIIFARVAAGGQTSFTVQYSAGQTASSGRLFVYEITHPDADMFVEASGGGNHGSTTSQVMTTDMGTVVTTNDFAIAFDFMNSGSNGGGISFTNGFTTDSSDTRAIAAHKDLTAPELVSTTASWTTARAGHWILVVAKAEPNIINADVVQWAASSGNTNVTSWTASLSTPATAGNTIILVHGALENADNRVYDTPSGFTLIRQTTRGIIFAKAATGGGVNYTVSYSAGETAAAGRLFVFEISDADQSTFIEASGGNTQTVVASVDMSTDTGSVDTANDVALAFDFMNSGSNGGSVAFSDGFVVADNDTRAIAGYKELSVAAPVTTTASWTTARAGHWILAVVKSGAVDVGTTVTLDQAEETDTALAVGGTFDATGVQSAFSTGNTQVTSWSATLGSAATAGNVIVLVHGALESANNRVYDTPSGFTLIRQTTRGIVFAKVASGGETSFTVQYSTGQAAAAGRLFVVELHHVDGTTFVEASGGNTHGTVASVAMSTDTGTVATVDDFALAFDWQSGGSNGGSIAFDSGFTLDLNDTRAFGGYKNLGAPAAVSTTASWTTARAGHWILLVMKAQGG